jgi:hypothetical protein
MRLGRIAKAAGVAIAASCYCCTIALANPSEPQFYCPWADGVVHLQFSAEDKKVQLAYSLHPRTLSLNVDDAPHPYSPGVTEKHTSAITTASMSTISILSLNLPYSETRR